MINIFQLCLLNINIIVTVIKNIPYKINFIFPNLSSCFGH